MYESSDFADATWHAQLPADLTAGRAKLVADGPRLRVVVE
jgi:hypothetical protein